jgi:RNA polymerase-binding transcription factor
MNRKQTTEDRRRYEVLSTMLTERQAEIRQKLRSLREVLPSAVTQVKDAEEQSVEEFALGMDFAIMEMESQTLRKIDQALARLEEGTYGVCSECDESISEARLKALPFASFCRDCQEQAEESEAVRNARPSRFFEDAPPASPRERRGSEKQSKSWSTGRRPEAAAPVAAAQTESAARSMRAGKPAKVARARS